MSKLERAWPSDAFDAVSILALEGEFEVEGTDGDQVTLEVDLERRATRDLMLEPAARWLQLQLWEHTGDAKFTLRLPKKKAWVLDLSAGRGEARVKGLQARLRVMIGKGEIQIKDCRGIFNLASGKGQVEVEDCVEAEMPARPAVPEPQFQFAHGAEPGPMPQSPPMPENPPGFGEHGTAGEFHVHFGRGPQPHVRRKIKHDVSWDWFGFDGEDWAEWGQQFGEQARVWAQQFAGHFVSAVDWLPEKAGVSIKIGRGDTKLEDIQAKSCSINVASGEAGLKGGRIETLDIGVSHGEIDCESVMPAGDWEIEIKNGSIRLALPSNAQARLDVATRHGDIDSEVPLVRVGRPGPESRYGGRMVGTLGQADDDIAQVSLTALKGDIDIRLNHEKSRFSPKPVPSAEPAETEDPESNPPAASSPQPAAGSATIVAPSAEAENTPIEPDKTKEKASAENPGPSYDSQLAILQALSAGQISVDEAAKLLRSMELAADQPKNVWGTVKNLFTKA